MGKPKIFISHAWKDKQLVRQLETELTTAGIKVWVDHSDVRGGDNLPKRISDALKWCNTLLLVWTIDADKSHWVELEWTNAISLKKEIIPCIRDNTKLPDILANKLYIDFYNIRQGLIQLLKTLGVDKPPQAIRPPKPQKQTAVEMMPPTETAPTKPKSTREEPSLFSLDKFVKISAGSFQMGSDSGEDDEKPVHTVCITKPFYLGKYQVTQEQWESVRGNNPSDFKGKTMPVETVSWDEVQEFIRHLNNQTGRDIFRLPTEAEWEYACRAGTTDDDTDKMDDMAWYDENADKKPHRVGIKQSNVWGLYDMHGNVWEWCSDWYDDYSNDTVNDPTGPDTGAYRVRRGGSWTSGKFFCRSANRFKALPSRRDGDIGFRLVRTV
jgi:formylglycine-generating enzyme required for sulfatase activity